MRIFIVLLCGIATAVACGIVSEANICDRTLCTWTTSNSTCGPDTTSHAECVSRYFIHYEAIAGDRIVNIYESERAMQRGYDSPFGWSLIPGDTVNCTVVSNTTAFLKTGSSDADNWAPAIVAAAIVGAGCICAACGAAIALVVWVYQNRVSERY